MKKILFGFVLSFLLLTSFGLTTQAQSVGQIINTGVNDLRSLSGGFNSITSEGLGIVGEGAAGYENIKDLICIVKGECKATPEGRFELPDPKKFNTIGENVSLRQYILNVLNFVLSFLGLIAVAALIYAGFLYVTSRGDDSANEKAKKIVAYAAIGILLILASFAIVNTILQNAGQGTDDRNGVSNVTPVIPTSPGGGTPGGGTNPASPNLRDTLVDPVIVEINGERRNSKNVAVSLEEARAGIDFGLDVVAFAIIDFGDGTSVAIDTDINPDVRANHKYGEVGSYNVAVLIQTADGNITGFNKRINIGGLKAQIRVPLNEILINTDVELSSQGSNSSVGTILAYNWSCDGGSGCFANVNEEYPTVQFSAPGTYQVTLELENSLGQKISETKQVAVIGDTPVASFNFQSTNNQQRPSEFRFDASNSMNVLGTRDGLNYEWNFDGVLRPSSTPSITYAFVEPGPKTVTLTVKQNFNSKTLVSETVSQNLDVPSTLSVDFDVY